MQQKRDMALYYTFLPQESAPLFPSTVMSDATSISTPQTFEPVLNIPALFSFLVVVVLFSFLQMRVSAIEQAAEKRNQALEQLRAVKTQELTGEVSAKQVEQAVQVYRQAYERVETLRTVIPGIARIVPPPSQSSQAAMRENQAAAQQFLGIASPSEEEEQPPPSNPQKVKEGNSPMRRGLSPTLLAVLAVVGVSQIFLLYLLSFDSMSMNKGL